MVMVMGLREAAAVAGVSTKVIRHCLAADVVRPKQKDGHWRFSADDALFFALRAAMPFAIDVDAQKALYALVVGRKRNGGGSVGWKLVDEDTLELGADQLRVSVDFSGIRRELARRLALLATRNTRVVSHPDVLSGEPVFAGTRVAVSRVGKLMLRGVPMAEMREDFPRLKDDDFELAKLLATIGPGPGRPRRRPPLRFVRETKRAG